MFDAKIRRLPSGCQDGAKLAPPSLVTCRRFEPSRFITKSSSDVGRHRPSLSSAAILVELGAGAEHPAAERHLLAVPREERAAVGPGPVRQPLHVRSVGLHRVDLHVAVAHAREHDEAVGRDRRLGVVARRPRQRRRRRAVGVGAIDVVAVVNRPDVAARVARPRRTLGATPRASRRRGSASRRDRSSRTSCARCRC